MQSTNGIFSKVLLAALFIMVSATGCNAQSDQPAPRKVITSGSGLIKVEPNMAQLTMQLEALHKDGGVAKSDVDGRVNLFLEALKTLNIDEADVVASALQLSPNYEYHHQKRQFNGYRASRTIDLTLNKLEQLNQLMDLALTSGIDQIGHIELKVANEQQYQQQAQQLAIADSQQKAAALAKAYGATLGPILQIEYQGSAVRYPQPSFGMKAMSRGATMEQAPPGRYLHDKIQFNDHINVIFELL
ncbi:SIMPL domain-containing protein [Porticoccaceae bacterium]|nr:SIMPL domain-containing protein [Porticoccaceae bacterium]MDB4076800.1 SIMPL domain-containing protein [Porticoccaceae bacterium]MDB9998962.1 SIMPL domain-containing protein [Porticoccaceae bacterium]